MNDDNLLIDEHLCLESKYFIDRLSSNLFMLGFSRKYLQFLKKLRADIDNLYWDL